jgi:hypothetical protein
MGKRTEDPEYIQEPEHDDDNYDGIQNGFDRPLHRYETIDQPKQNANNNQDEHDLNQRH